MATAKSQNASDGDAVGEQKQKSAAAKDAVDKGKQAKSSRGGKGGDKKQAAQGAVLNDKIQELKQYFDESKIELKKIVWPSRKETIATCIAVVCMVIVMALFLGVVDLSLTKVVSWILS